LGSGLDLDEAAILGRGGGRVGILAARGAPGHGKRLSSFETGPGVMAGTTRGGLSSELAGGRTVVVARDQCCGRYSAGGRRRPHRLTAAAARASADDDEQTNNGLVRMWHVLATVHGRKIPAV
jgi:hypothetical protein